MYSSDDPADSVLLNILYSPTSTLSCVLPQIDLLMKKSDVPNVKYVTYDDDVKGDAVIASSYHMEEK